MTPPAEDAATGLLDRILAVPGGDRRFDPYRDRCPVHDRPNGPAIRRDNLVRYLAAAIELGPVELWVAEAPGHRGSRRSGLPLVPEVLLAEASRRFGVLPPFRTPTATQPQAARTPLEVWAQARRRTRPPLLWNAVLHHPHHSGEPFSHRSPTVAERRLFAPILAEVVAVFEPARVVAIGRAAEASLDAIGVDAIHVRHPSRGGLREFRSGMADLAPS